MTPPPEDKQAALLAGAFGTVAAVLGLLGGSSGGIERMLRNNSLFSSVALFAVGGGIGLALLVAVGRFTEKTRKWALTVGGFAFVAGLLGAILLAASTPSLRDRPSVTARVTTEGGLAVEATVRASGLHSDEHLRIIVDGLDDETSHRLYDARVGPTTAGTVDQTFRIPIPMGHFKEVVVSAIGAMEELELCRPSNVRNGCAIIQLPRAVSRPMLSSSWTFQAGGRSILTLDISGGGMATDTSVWISVFGELPDGMSLLTKGHLAVDASGHTIASVAALFPATASRYCVIASTLRPVRSAVGDRIASCSAMASDRHGLNAVWLTGTIPTPVLHAG